MRKYGNIAGRSGISAASRRRLCGCYISYEDFTSKLSVLEQASVVAEGV
jgi:hypothetical protein